MSAGGDENCDATNLLAMPTFATFSSNLTQAQADCNGLIDEYSTNLNVTEMQSGLNDGYRNCYDSFLGFMIQVLTEISESLGVDPNDLLNIMVGGARIPTSFPLNCIANELTSVFPSIMEVSGDLQARINDVINNGK